MSPHGGQVEGAARRSADLSPSKRALLEKWAKGGAAAAGRIAPRSAADGGVPLSFVQERQLFLELLDPQTAVNNLAVCLRLDGSLDAPSLERCVNVVLARHEALRTSFETERGRPVARVAPVLATDLGLVDLTSAPGDREALALRRAESEAGRPFDLGRPPLLRMRTYRLEPDAHVLLLVVHHSIGDGWSLGVFLRELFTLYRALRTGTPAGLAPLPIQYADFAAWQRQSACGPEFERQMRFWEERLAGELPVLDLPVDHPRPARQTFGGATHRFSVPQDLAAGIRELSRLHDATPFMTLVAAFQVLLHRLCGQDDILVGTPTAGRARPETADLIGAFINTLVLRSDLSGDPSFAELLVRVREVSLSAYAHQDVPFERLVAHLRPQRDLSRTPVFQVAFVLQNSPLPPLEMPGLAVRLLPIDVGAAQFDLTLTMTESERGIEGAFAYNTDLFDRATIERMSGAFSLLVADAVARPQTPISRLAILSASERHRLVTGLNATQADFPRDRCVHELFEAQAARTPDAVALVCGGERLTYRELDRWAGGLAGALRDRGVGPDVRVGVRLERSPALVASLLAVMKAGGAYLPVDPSLPRERVEFMLADAKAHVLLTDDPLAAFGAPHVVTVDRMRDAERAIALVAGARAPTPRDLVYVIYTSGSTGLPKGVLVRHGSLLNLLWSMRQTPGLGAGDVLLAVTSVSFDIAALELWLPLITGATVVIATREMTTDRRKLLAAIEVHGVTALQATPAAWRMILQGGWTGEPRLTALCGGEALTPELADQLLARVGRLWNVYGPTETTVWSCACEVRRGQRPITIGRPIANTQVYVLDRHLEPVPVGVAGELHIGGDGVSQGYLDRPELTAAKFIANPFLGAAGGTSECLFATGDRARLLPDGTIELLGRQDDQVKIHGFRVELGEVERALGRHAAVREAAVVARGNAAGDRILVAYFVTACEPAPEAAELRDFLRSALPAYMVPALFVRLPSLPLTTAGKVDRRALPEAVAPAAGPHFAAPRTPLEERLALTYAQVLGVERVGVHDNFFDTGGGSIQILEILVRTQSDGVSLTPEAFFEHQTVAELAAFLARGADDA